MGKQKRLSLVPIYCIDASALINLTRRPGLPYPPYPRDVFTQLWKKLESMISSEELISHERVYKEVKKRDDELSKWCKKHKKMFRKIDECQIEKIQEIKSKYDKNYWDREISKNSEWADPWLIALSICEDAIIITDEKTTPNHIPYIANYFNRQCLNLMDFFRNVGIIWR